MRIRKVPLIICLLIPLAIGGLSVLLTNGSMEAFSRLKQPPLSPPQWAFPVAWTILYLLMGWASYLVYVSDAPHNRIKRALVVYAVQLLLNFCWTMIYFAAAQYLLAFIWLVVLFAMILITFSQFRRRSKLAAYLLIPYIAWVAFAGYLNMGVYLLNR